MLTLLRRFLAVAALMVWQGGFVFYTAFVVPIGTDFLGSSTRQGFITRRVTDVMNRCGAVALACVAWELSTGRDGRLQRARVALLLAMVAAAVVLFHLHGRLEGLLDVENEDVLDRRAFRALHRGYLWVSTAQWACAVIYLLATLAAWKRQDGTVNAAGTSGQDLHR